MCATLKQSVVCEYSMFQIASKERKTVRLVLGPVSLSCLAFYYLRDIAHCAERRNYSVFAECEIVKKSASR